MLFELVDDELRIPTDPAIIDPGGTPLPPAATAVLPQVEASEAGVPLSQWRTVRVRPARRPDGSIVYIKDTNTLAGLEPDPLPSSEQTTAPSTDQDQTTAPAPAAAELSTPAVPIPAVSYVHPGTVLVPSGAKARVRANLAALEVVAACTAAGRPATPGEQDRLALWSGWGAVADIFDDAKPEWASERDRLRELLSPAEYRDARASTLNAHYTDPAIAAAMWTALDTAGFSGGRVLEPGCGAGTFIGLAPVTATMVGVEIDGPTAQIAHLLYPQTQIRQEGFELTRVPEAAFTAAIGNVPFGDYSLHDPVHNPAGHRIHNHFLLKSLRLTAPGGYVVALTSHYTLDAANDRARRDMHALADLIGAVRLPSGAFRRVAGTDVVTDILVFRRREEDREPGAGSWLRAVSEDLVTDTGRVFYDRQGRAATAPISTYFTDHPEHVIGRVVGGHGLYGPEMIVTDDDLDTVPHRITAALTAIITAAKVQGLGLTATEASVETGLSAGIFDAASLYTHTRPIGRVEYDTDTGEFSQIGIGGQPEPLKVFTTRVTETRHLLRLRDLAEAAIASQRDTASTTAQRHGVRRELGATYDAYVAAYGPLNRFKMVGGMSRTPAQAAVELEKLTLKWRADNGPATGVAYDGPLPGEVAEDLEQQAWTAKAPVRRQTHLELLRSDPSLAGLIALEEYNDETGQVRKAAIFDRDVIVAPTPISSADSPAEAVSIAMGESAEVSLPRVAQLLGQDHAVARESIRGLVFADPDHPDRLLPAALALSGNIHAKHDRAVELLSADPGNRDWVELEAAIRAKLPVFKQPSEIGAVKLGPTWITPADYGDFIRETFGADTVTVERAAGTWVVDVPAWQQRSALMRTEFGADHSDEKKALTAIELTERLLNQAPIVVRNSAEAQRDHGAPDVDAQATIMAQVQAQKITGEFQQWLWADDQRRDRLIREWNRRFNTWIKPVHDGSAMQLPGLSPRFVPHSTQRNAVARIVAEPTVLLDHVVGAGKTGIMFMAATELKRRGLVRQPWIVVPTHLIEQFGRELKQWYPAARVLMGAKGMSPQQRRVFAAQTATSDWDMVIVPGSVFERIGVHPDRTREHVQAQINALGAERSQLSNPSRTTVKRIERAKKVLERRLLKLTDQTDKDTGVTFEQTGCDYLFVDEAHDYKNKTRISTIDALSLPNGSLKAEDLAMKLSYLRERKRTEAAAAGVQLVEGQERVATFATGTPVANSLAEAWVMQQYLRPDVLAHAGVASITDWAATFTETKSMTVTNSTGSKLQVVSKVAAFTNTRAMSMMSQQFTDVVTREQIPADLPHVVSRIVTTQAGQEVRDFITDLDWRSDNPPMGSDGPATWKDNPLKILNDGRNAALDPRLANLAEADAEHTRAGAVAREVAAIYHQNAERIYRGPDGAPSMIPGAVQVVFCDRGTPKAGGQWSVYQAIKDQLVSHGVPEEKIAFIHDAHTATQRLQLQADCRSGKIAVLIGSTPKMGTGMNIQDRLLALHHADVPWRPADLEQRDGRAIRQGNQNPGIHLLRYVTEGTTDTLMWGTIEEKAAFIDQYRRGQLDDVTAVAFDEEDLTAAAAATKAAATGDPRFIRLVELDAQVKELAALGAAHNDGKRHARAVLRHADQQIPLLEERIEQLETLTPAVTVWAGSDRRPFTIDGRSFIERGERNDAVLTTLRQIWMKAKAAHQGYTHRYPVAEFPGGIAATASVTMLTDKMYVRLDAPGEHETSFEKEQLFKVNPPRPGEDRSAWAAVARGVATKLENLYANIPAVADRMRDRLADHRTDIEVYAPRVEQPFDRAQELATKTTQLQEIRLHIQAAEQSAEAVARRAAAAERMSAAGREPGWSLQLNPTERTVIEAGYPDNDAGKAAYIASVQREHARRAIEHAEHQQQNGRANQERGVATLADLLAAGGPSEIDPAAHTWLTQQPPEAGHGHTVDFDLGL